MYRIEGKLHLTYVHLLVALAVFVGSTVAFGSDECEDDCEEEDTEIDECLKNTCSYYANCTNTGNFNSWTTYQNN